MPAARRGDAQRRHEPVPVRLHRPRDRPLREAADERPERPVGGRAVRHERELVRGVERDEVPPAHPARDGRLPAGVREDRLDEALAERGVLEPPLLLDGQERQPRREDRDEQPDAVAPGRAAARRVDGHALEAAGGRALLGHVAGEIELRELADARLGEPAHRLGVVLRRSAPRGGAAQRRSRRAGRARAAPPSRPPARGRPAPTRRTRPARP